MQGAPVFLGKSPSLLRSLLGRMGEPSGVEICGNYPQEERNKLNFLLLTPSQQCPTAADGKETFPVREEK